MWGGFQRYIAPWLSRLRHRYQDATEQYGRQAAAICSISAGVGNSGRLYEGSR